MSDQDHDNFVYIATRVTLIGSVLDLALGVLKIVVGLMASSFALVTDGIHSLSDLVTDVFVLIVTRYSRAKPDRDHPYGHRRFETLGTIALGMVLFAVACIICFDSVRRMNQIDPLPVPGWPGLVAALLSIIGKEWIYRYTRNVAIALNSNLLLANAWHSRTDAFSSIAVLIGILGAMLGFPVMDLVAAFIVGLMIAKISWDLIATSIRELVDTALPEDQVQAIRAHVNAMEGIWDAHELRTRRHGGQILVDLHVQVNDRISVSEGHYLSDRMSASLKSAFPEITDVVVHIDPELDTDTPPDLSLPLRKEVRKTLAEYWLGHLAESDIKRLELHYLDGKVEADVYIDNYMLNSELTDKLNNLVKDLEWLRSINFYAIP